MSPGGAGRRGAGAQGQSSPGCGRYVSKNATEEGTLRSGIAAHPHDVKMDFLSSGGRVADGDANSKSFECREMKRRHHWVGKFESVLLNDRR